MFFEIPTGSNPFVLASVNYFEKNKVIIEIFTEVDGRFEQDVTIMVPQLGNTPFTATILFERNNGLWKRTQIKPVDPTTLNVLFNNTTN